MQQNMKTDSTDRFEAWSRLLQTELSEIIEPLGRETDNYGFALAIPEDVGSPSVMYAVGKESKLIGEQAGSLVWLDRRYSAVEWSENWIELPRSTETLQEIVAEHKDENSALEDSAFAEAQNRFISDCASTCMNAMLRCDTNGLFGKIWYKILFMSDTDHPVLGEAFAKLNTGRALEEAAQFFASTAPPTARPPNINDAYTNEQIALIAEGSLPDRGVYCEDCEIYVPIFKSVDDPERLNGIGFKDTLQKLMKATGCSKKWAEIWMYHLGGACNTKRCQACGEFLRTKVAKQCLSCGAEWRKNHAVTRLN